MNLLTARQVAERLQISEWTVYALVRAGQLPAVRRRASIDSPISAESLGLRHSLSNRRESLSNSLAEENVYYFFDSLRSCERERRALWLEPEPECSSMLGDLDTFGDKEIREAAWAYLRYLDGRGHKAGDDVPIYWSVIVGGPGEGSQRGSEQAPGQTGNGRGNGFDKDFLTYYSWPIEETTDRRVNWFTMQVRMSRFPDFWNAVGWKPSPLQSHCPMIGILQGYLDQ